MKMTWLSYTGQPNVWVVKFDDGVEVRTEGPSYMEPDEPEDDGVQRFWAGAVLP